MQNRLTLAITLITIGACTQPTDSDHGVRVQLSTNKEVFNSADTLHVTLNAINGGSQTVTLNAGSCPFNLDIINEHDEAIQFGPHLCSADAVFKILEPGESLMQEYSSRLTDSAGNPLPAGKYELRGWAYGAGIKTHSPDVTIRIVSGN